MHIEQGDQENVEEQETGNEICPDGLLHLGAHHRLWPENIRQAQENGPGDDVGKNGDNLGFHARNVGSLPESLQINRSISPFYRRTFN